MIDPMPSSHVAFSSQCLAPPISRLKSGVSSRGPARPVLAEMARIVVPSLR
jgi:hypothetical protein